MTAPAPRPAPPRAAAPGAGRAEVDAAVAALAGLDELPVADHVARFTALHEALTAALAAVDGT